MYNSEKGEMHMFGAIIGDTVGSIYEFDNIKTKDFPLYAPDCQPTDDSYMTIAVANACMEYDGDLTAFREILIDEMHRLGDRYPYSGYGNHFMCWLLNKQRTPYNSCGNGSAMRASPCGWMCDTLEETLALAEASADVTHNHPEGIKGAQAIAAAIFLARTGSSREQIRAYISETFGYNLNRTCDEIRPVYGWGALCQDTVPEALVAFFDSVDFEDAIRNAVSLGGDCDTLTCITGSVAEAHYGVSNKQRRAALCIMRRYMHSDELESVERFHREYVRRRGW